MSRKTLLAVIFAGVTGATLGSVGITLGMWQCWLVIVMYVLHGINERTK